MDAEVLPLCLRGVSKAYRLTTGEVVPALDRVDLDVHAGEVVCLMGPSGCGKSTTLHVAAGWLQPDAGEALARGEVISGPGPDRPFCYQESTIFQWLTVRENVAFGLQAQRRDCAVVDELLEEVGLAPFAHAYPKELSGGMMKRVELARAIAAASERAVLLLDESFASVDPLTRLSLHELLRRLLVERGHSAILSSHDPYECAFVADRIALMAPRPSRILEVIDVPLPAERTRELHTSGEFQAFASEVLSRMLEVGGDVQ